MTKYQNPYIDCPKCGDYESFLAVEPELGAEEGGHCQSCDLEIKRLNGCQKQVRCLGEITYD